MDRKMITQIVLLVVLLGGLVASTIFMISRLGGSNRRPESKATAATAPVKRPATQVAGSAQSEEGAGAVVADAGIAMNENLFKVYDLNTERNPFYQEKQWYAEKLNTIPGYPQLVENEYFESMEAFFPDVEELFGEESEFGEIDLSRSNIPDVYNLSGVSEDGKINTTLTLSEPAAESVKLTWNAEGMRQSTREGGTSLSLDNGSITHVNPYNAGNLNGTLGLPGETPFFGMMTGDPQSDSIACRGINLQGRHPSALIYLGNQPYIASTGTILAPNYRVDEITVDGVVLVDLRDGMSKWIGLNGQMSVAAPANGQ